MISFTNVSKKYRTHGADKVVLDRASFTFPEGRNVGILGSNGAGKSTLIRLIAGCEGVDSGRVSRLGRISFPLGFTGTFHPHLTGRQNATFVARIYGERVDDVVGFVEDFTELGAYLDMDISTYSAGMLAKLAFGISLAIDFDVYLVDEVTEVGDARFRRKCAAIFADRMARSDIVMVSHNVQTIRAYCDMAAVLANGRLVLHDTVDAAMRAYAQVTEEHNA